MPEEPQISPRLLLGAILFIVTTMALSIFILFRVARPKPAAPQAAQPSRTASIFTEAQNADQYAAQLAGRKTLGRERSSGLPADTRPVYTEEPAQMPQPAAPAPAPQPAAARPAPVQAPAPEMLSDAERSALLGTVGKLDDEAARRLGATSPLLVRGVRALMKHPKVIRFLLNNEFLIKGFVNNPKCKDAQALTDFLADPKKSGGVSLFMDGFSAGFRNPDALNAVLGSGITNAALSCPSVKTMTNSKSMVVQIAQSNPQILMMLADPNLLMAMMKNPTVLGAVSAFQNSARSSTGD